METCCNVQGPPDGGLARAPESGDGRHRQNSSIPPTGSGAAALELPSSDDVARLTKQYFASVFGVITQFQEDLKAFRQNPDSTSRSWLAMLFAILALGYQAEENTEQSIYYENAAWKYLPINDSLFEQSTTALEATLLIIYGRVLRGDNVSSDLSLAYKKAKNIGCHQCSTEPMTCEEHRIYLVSLKTLLFMNYQVYGDCQDPSVLGYILLAGRTSVETESLSMNVNALSRFLVQHYEALGILDTVTRSMRQDEYSDRRIPGVAKKLSRLENDCNNELDTDLSASDSDKRFYREILLYTIRHIRQLVCLSYTEKPIDEDIAPNAESAAILGIDSAICTLKIFYSLTEDKQFEKYAWTQSWRG
ncbi:hypothetical protein N7476_005071 [Penicillium atrosanguineum]|uniref:Uncharacterized protein n=1 Tax=Penicillium atrosanguineum TaxID=1132637 RepID=A0A9W9PYR5_9EURO|nr:hypothetical protein N7476_005071 [Penicillium atrosanguineum]